MNKKVEEQRQPSLKEQLAASRAINSNISGTPAPKPAKARKEPDALDPGKMKVAELKEALDSAGVVYGDDAKKADLVELLTAHRAKQ